MTDIDMSWVAFDQARGSKPRQPAQQTAAQQAQSNPVIPLSPEAKAQVAAMQKAAGLPVTGQLNSQTIAYAKSHYATPQQQIVNKANKAAASASKKAASASKRAAAKQLSAQKKAAAAVKRAAAKQLAAHKKQIAAQKRQLAAQKRAVAKQVAATKRNLASQVRAQAAQARAAKAAAKAAARAAAAGAKKSSSTTTSGVSSIKAPVIRTRSGKGIVQPVGQSIHLANRGVEVFDLAEHVPGTKFRYSHGWKKLDAPTIDAATVKDLHGGSAHDHLIHHPSDGTAQLTPERAALHDKIVSDILDGHASQKNPSMTMLGGGPASGKTKAANAAEAAHPGAVTINPDDIKGMLPEYAKLPPEQAAGHVHEESSYLAKRVMAEALQRKLHIVLDAVGDNSVPSQVKKINQAKDAGYKVHASYVTVPTEIAQKRAYDRGVKSGRVVHPAVIDSLHAGVSGVFPDLIQHFDTVQLHDNSGAWTKVLSKAEGQAAVVHNQRLYNEFMKKAKI